MSTVLDEELVDGVDVEALGDVVPLRCLLQQLVGISFLLASCPEAVVDAIHGVFNSKLQRCGAVKGRAGAIAEEEPMAGADCGTELILVLGGESGGSSGRAVGAAGVGIGDGEEGGPKLVHGHGRLQLTRVLG